MHDITRHITVHDSDVEASVGVVSLASNSAVIHRTWQQCCSSHVVIRIENNNNNNNNNNTNYNTTNNSNSNSNNTLSSSSLARR